MAATAVPPVSKSAGDQDDSAPPTQPWDHEVFVSEVQDQNPQDYILPCGLVLRFSPFTFQFAPDCRPTLLALKLAFWSVFERLFRNMRWDLNRLDFALTCREVSLSFARKTYAYKDSSLLVHVQCIVEGLAHLSPDQQSKIHLHETLQASLQDEAHRPFQPVMDAFLKALEHMLWVRTQQWTLEHGKLVLDESKDNIGASKETDGVFCPNPLAALWHRARSVHLLDTAPIQRLVKRFKTEDCGPPPK